MIFENEPCRYCSGNCPNDHDNMCDGYSGDVGNLYEDIAEEDERDWIDEHI